VLRILPFKGYYPAYTISGQVYGIKFVIQKTNRENKTVRKYNDGILNLDNLCLLARPNGVAGRAGKAGTENGITRNLGLSSTP